MSKNNKISFLNSLQNKVGLFVDKIDNYKTDLQNEKLKNILENEINQRIILSAPFGMGKTTFIKNFFTSTSNVNANNKDKTTNSNRKPNNSGYNYYHLYL